MPRRKVKRRVLKIPKKIGGGDSKLTKFLKTLPNRSLSNFDIKKLAKKLNISNFRGVFMIDTLPKKPWSEEKGVFNLGKSSTEGTHWVSYIKSGEYARYFDSHGKQAPSELVKYLKGVRISSNRTVYQQVGSVNCGQLCLAFLSNLIK